MVSRAQVTQTDHSQGIKGGVVVGKLTGSGRDSAPTWRRSPSPTQAAKPNRNASSSLCTEPFNTGEEG